LEVGAPAATSFEPISIEQLRTRWLDHHEHVLRSSPATLNRYRTATDHLLAFARTVPLRQAGHLTAQHAERFVRHLHEIKVAPNGHPRAVKRELRDKGIKYILCVCRTMFNFGSKRRHLPPYAENPFSVIQIDRMPIEDSKPIRLLEPKDEAAFFEACDVWQFPIFLTLALTGIRPGELTHLLLPDDLDLVEGWLHVRNKPDLGWQVKTRHERSIPLMPELVAVLQKVVGSRTCGPVFQRRRFTVQGELPKLNGIPRAALSHEIEQRVTTTERVSSMSVCRGQRVRICKKLWVDLGAIREDRVRAQFMQLTKSIGLGSVTTPKLFRHAFATLLQDANVDPLIRNQLMGHVPSNGLGHSGGGGLAMTAVYTHTRPDTIRQQLFAALSSHNALAITRTWVQIVCNELG
jgi:integrase